MKVLEQKIVKKHEITSGTKEWADHNINCIKGCSNNCRYCYAKIIAKRFGRCTEQTWKEMEVNYSAVNKNFSKYNGRVMFPSSHDIVDTPEVKEACFTVMEKLLRVGNEVLVTTKPKLCVTKDIVTRFYQYKSQIQFRFTITSINNQLLSFWEPNAPTFEERFESLKYAYNSGFKTSVSIEPFLDYNPVELIKTLSPYITESEWLGVMNYIPKNNVFSADIPLYEEIRGRYELNHLKEVVREVKNFPKIRFKDSIVIRLGMSSYT